MKRVLKPGGRLLQAWLFLIAGPAALQAQTTVAFAPGGQQLVLLDFSTFPLGQVVPPRGGGCLTAIPVCDIRGELEIVMQDGKPMLRASGRSSFVVRLPQRLPNDFTLEFDLIPKSCCQPEDLSFEGVADIQYGQTAVSANVLWHHNSHAIVGGVKDAGFSTPMPEKLSAAVRGSLANIAVSFRGTSLTMYTNDEEIYSVQREFVRGQVLRVFLGGQNDTDRAVYLARLRIAGGGAAAVATSPSALNPASNPLPNVGPGGTATATNTNASMGRGGRGNLPPGRSGSTNPPTAQGTAAATASPTGTTAPNPAGTTGSGTTVTPGARGGTASVVSNAPAASNLSVTGEPLQARISWTAAPGANRYVLRRAFAGTSTWSTVLDQGAPLTKALDVLPDYKRTYTYQLLAYQPGGSFGTIAADYTPPAPADPTGFYARAMGPGEVEFGWLNVPNVNFLLNGAGAGNGVSVVGMNADPTAWFIHTLRGIPAGTHTWTLASSYQPGGVMTPASAWRTTTATVTGNDPAQRYRLTALGFKALQVTADNIFAIDGMGDEVYVAAMINTTTRSQSGTNISTARSATFGDVGTANAFQGRIRAGTYGPTGGIRVGDAIPVSLNLSNPTGAPGILDFPLMLWEGVLDDNAMVIVEPTVWEEDSNNEAHVRWVSQTNNALTNSGVAGPILTLRDQGQVGPVTESGSGVNIWNDDGKDRPIGLSNIPGHSGISTVFSPAFTASPRYLVLTKVAVENLLNGPAQRAGAAPGLIVVLLADNASGLTASYELYLRVERVPIAGGNAGPGANTTSSSGSAPGSGSNSGGTTNPPVTPVTAIPVAPPTGTATPITPPPNVPTPPNAPLAGSPGALRLTPCAQRSTGGPAPNTITKQIGSPGGARFLWNRVAGTNYVVERAPVGATQWVLIGSSCGGLSPLTELQDEVRIRDLAGGLQMGQTVTYRVTAIGPNGETGWNTLTWKVPCVQTGTPTATVTGSTVQLKWRTERALCGDENSVQAESFTVSTSFGYTQEVTPKTYETSHVIYGVPVGTHTFSVAGRWQPDGLTSKANVTVVVRY